MVILVDKIENSEYKYTAKLILTVHDEIVVECDYADRYKVAKMVSDSVDEGFNMYFPDFPMYTDAVIGPCWLKGECIECGHHEMVFIDDEHYGTKLVCDKCGGEQE
jgi:hypothetical protein